MLTQSKITYYVIQLDSVILADYSSTIVWNLWIYSVLIVYLFPACSNIVIQNDTVKHRINIQLRLVRA